MRLQDGKSKDAYRVYRQLQHALKLALNGSGQMIRVGNGTGTDVWLFSSLRTPELCPGAAWQANAIAISGAVIQPPALKQLARSYCLTKAEERTLTQWVAGEGDPQQVAQELGVGIRTIRTHLSNIFFKTGTRNQGELLRLVMKLPSTLLDLC
jgi:DNA-binding CsgD family transcriptional regulator